MSLDKLRNIFWDEFFELKNNLGNISLFNELTKERYTGKHAIQVYDQNNLRLMIGINEKYARCSLHITGENLGDVYARLKQYEDELYDKFTMKRESDLTIKRNRKSVVIQYRDYGFSFPPSSETEKEILMKWMYHNAIAMNETPSYFQNEGIEKPKQKNVENFKPSISKEIVPEIIANEFHDLDYDELEKKIYECNEPCKKPKEQMLLGRLLNGNPEKIEMMIIGIGPKETYAEKRKNRVVFGEYSPTGRRVRKLISKLEKKRGSLSVWGTNAIKCDHLKEQEKNNIIRCKKYLIHEIELFSPKVIVLFGARLSKLLLNQSLEHGRVRKLLGEYTCIQSIHPASLASGKRFDNENMELLADAVIKILEAS